MTVKRFPLIQSSYSDSKNTIDAVIFNEYDHDTKTTVEIRVHWTEAFNYADNHPGLYVASVRWSGNFYEYQGLRNTESYAEGLYDSTTGKLDSVTTRDGPTILRRS